MKIKFSRQISEKYSNTKFHENPSSGSRFLVNDQRDTQILFYVFISIYNSLHVSSTSCSSSGETICINTASGNSHSMLVAEMCAGWKKKCSKHVESYKQKYIHRKEFCITLVIYQESLHDARSTKYKKWEQSRSMRTDGLADRH